MTNSMITNQSDDTLLSLRNIHKTFGGQQALVDVSFDLKAGEIHALVGENGAGKSTLIKIVAGAYVPDEGVIEIEGKSFEQLNPTQACSLGVAAVYQEFNLLPELSVSENIFLTKPPMSRIGLIDVRQRNQKTYLLLERLGAHKQHIEPSEIIRNLTVGEQQIVEIAKALAINAHILIMDEPSSMLPSRDLDRLFMVIRTLREKGHGIIYISHRLNEVFELADRVTVLKDGQKMATKNVDETNETELVHLMVGRPLQDMYPPPDVTLGKVLLEVRDLCIEDVVFDVNFEVREGEVVGLAGLVGSGRTTVCRSLVGLGDVRKGEILYQSRPVPKTLAATAQAGMVLIPEDRKLMGLVLNQSMRFNVSLPNLTQFSHRGVLNRPSENRAVQSAITELDIRPPVSELTAENLSGGNQQKVVIGKWLITNPKLVIFDEPTRGIDVGAKAEIYLRIRELTHRSVGVIMASSELPELLGMCDRILVFHEGCIAGELKRDEFSEEAVMMLATATNHSETVSHQ